MVGKAPLFCFANHIRLLKVRYSISIHDMLHYKKAKCNTEKLIACLQQHCGFPSLYKRCPRGRNRNPVQDNTVWLTNRAIGQLFDVDCSVATKYLKIIYESGKMDDNSTIY